jgi:hypothetical protein
MFITMVASIGTFSVYGGNSTSPNTFLRIYTIWHALRGLDDKVVAMEYSNARPSHSSLANSWEMPVGFQEMC